MNKKPVNITPEDRELYNKVTDLHRRNHTLNHEEDRRRALKIVKAGIQKIPTMSLKTLR